MLAEIEILKNFAIFSETCALEPGGAHTLSLAHSVPLRVKDLFCSINFNLRRRSRLVSLVRVVYVLFPAQSESAYPVSWGFIDSGLLW